MVLQLSVVVDIDLAHCCRLDLDIIFKHNMNWNLEDAQCNPLAKKTSMRFSK